MKITRLFFCCVCACNIMRLNGSNPNNRNTKYLENVKPKYGKMNPKVSLDSERSVTLPNDTLSVFKKAAENNTNRGIQTAGFLLGNTRDNNIEVTHLVIPKQRNNRNFSTITYSGWNDVVTFRNKKGYKIIGAIRSHLGNRVELTDMDCHDLSQIQKGFQDAISVVYTPKVGYGVFKLSAIGRRIIENCRHRSRSNHNHKRRSEIAANAKYYFSRKKIIKIDLRNNEINSRTSGKPQIKIDKKPIRDPPGTVLFPENMIDTFFDIAKNHTASFQNPQLETLAYFLGNTLHGRITFTHMMVPQQVSDTEYSMTPSGGVQQILNYGDRNGLTFTGAIHTHPRGAIIPSDGDCRAMSQCQRIFRSFVSMVSCPHAGFNTFRLTDYGLRMVESTPMYGMVEQGGRFYHTPNVLENVPYRFIKTNIVVVDFRRNSYY